MHNVPNSAPEINLKLDDLHATSPDNALGNLYCDHDEEQKNDTVGGRTAEIEQSELRKNLD